MGFDFKNEMANRTDEELIGILTVSRKDYLPEALEAAEIEFNKRNIQKERITALTEKVGQDEEIRTQRSNEPLNVLIKIGTFLFPMLLTIILSGLYKSKGYDRKASELVTWTILGICFYIVVGILIAAFS